MSARYHAPAVAYPFARPCWAAWALALAWLALLAAMLAWSLGPHAGRLQQGLAVCAVLVAAALLHRQWRLWPQGQLLWNGEHWLLEPGESGPVQMRRGLDGGHWLWLRVSSVSAPKPLCSKRKLLWIFLIQSHAPAQWGDLRRAVYSPVVPLAEQG